MMWSGKMNWTYSTCVICKKDFRYMTDGNTICNVCLACQSSPEYKKQEILSKLEEVKNLIKEL